MPLRPGWKENTARRGNCMPGGTAMAVESAPDVVVIGAGAIGCSIAYYLARAGASVDVVERGEIGREASWASAGMISAAAVGDDPLARFYREGAALFPEFAASIREETGIDIGY